MLIWLCCRHISSACCSFNQILNLSWFNSWKYQLVIFQTGDWSTSCAWCQLAACVRPISPSSVCGGRSLTRWSLFHWQIGGVPCRPPPTPHCCSADSRRPYVIAKCCSGRLLNELSNDEQLRDSSSSWWNVSQLLAAGLRWKPSNGGEDGGSVLTHTAY